MDETAWEDINPPMGLVPRREQPLPCSAKLQPATSEHFRNELAACLALVAPAGMTEESRRDWLAVAWGTLKDLPADLLTFGCAHARKVCDHPSKIVPAIIAHTAESMERRRQWMRDSMPVERLPPPDYCTPAQAAEILREFGLK